MDIAQALKLMKYSSIDDITSESLKQVYRKLMRKHHPDLFNNDKDLLKQNEAIAKEINEAHEVLTTVLNQMEAFKNLEKLNRRDEIFAVIPFMSYVGLYSGETIELKGSADSDGKTSFILTKSNIRSHRIVLYIECAVVCNDITYSFNCLKPVIIGDEYEIECTLPVSNMGIIDVTIKAYEKNLSISLTSNDTHLKLKYDNSVNITLHLRKKLVTENN